ncbi:MAG: hypothetical protein PVG78_04525 [Desulfobacterales bacterium]
MLRALIRKFRSVREKAFKTCTMCRHPWPCRDDFIDDPSLKVSGYMANFDRLELGILLFDHLSCKTTLSLSADLFRDLYDGPVYTERKTGTDECPGYCLDKEELRPCPAECECAYVRDILNIIVSRKTAGTELPA